LTRHPPIAMPGDAAKAFPHPQTGLWYSAAFIEAKPKN